ncbi:MAG TPA: ABC transporter permease [Acidimicrobiia bacterium]
MSRPGWLRLALAETRMQIRLLLRNVVAAFFTLVLPLIFFVVINAFLGGGELQDGSPTSNYYTPAIAVFALVTATFTNLAISTSMSRDSGVLKRVYGSPMPLSAHVTGRIVSATLVGMVSVVVMLVVGALVFDVAIPWARLPHFFLVLFVGAATFSALGITVSMLTPNAKAAPAVANAVIFPVLFISGIFFPIDDAPAWMRPVARVLPLGPFVESAVDQFLPWLIEEPIWSRMAIVAAWGLMGMALAVRMFRWEPSGTRRQSLEIET